MASACAKHCQKHVQAAVQKSISKDVKEACRSKRGSNVVSLRPFSCETHVCELRNCCLTCCAHCVRPVVLWPHRPTLYMRLLRISQLTSLTSMAHRAYKTLRMPMTVPEGFTLKPVDGNILIAPDEPYNYTTVMIPLAVEQHAFMATTVTTQPSEAQKIPGYVKVPYIGFHWVFYSFMDCLLDTSVG